MENQKLIGMTAFVLEQDKALNGDPSNYGRHSLELILKYARFLSQPLELWMFIPVDKYGNVLSEPKSMVGSILDGDNGAEWALSRNEYQQAKSRCLFEGFKICNRNESVKCVVNDDFHFSYDRAIENGETIESMIRNELILTDTARNQIFG